MLKNWSWTNLTEEPNWKELFLKTCALLKKDNATSILCPCVNPLHCIYILSKTVTFKRFCTAKLGNETAERNRSTQAKENVLSERYKAIRILGQFLCITGQWIVHLLHVAMIAAIFISRSNYILLRESRVKPKCLKLFRRQIGPCHQSLYHRTQASVLLLYISICLHMFRLTMRLKVFHCKMVMSAMAFTRTLNPRWEEYLHVILYIINQESWVATVLGTEKQRFNLVAAKNALIGTPRRTWKYKFSS